MSGCFAEAGAAAWADRASRCNGRRIAPTEQAGSRESATERQAMSATADRAGHASRRSSRRLPRISAACIPSSARFCRAKCRTISTQWEEQVEPQLGLSRDHAAISAAVLQQLALGIIALAVGRGAVRSRAACWRGLPTPRSRRRFWAWCWWWSSATRFCLRCSSRTRGDGGQRGWCGPFACCCG